MEGSCETIVDKKSTDEINYSRHLSRGTMIYVAWECE